MCKLIITPGAYSWIGTSAGIRGINLNYVITQDESGAELYIDRGKNFDEENKSIFDQLYVYKDEIEKTIPEKLSWERLDGKRASRIRITVPGGYRSPVEEWESIQTRLISAMNALAQAIKPYLKKLYLGNQAENNNELTQRNSA